MKNEQDSKFSILTTAARRAWGAGCAALIVGVATASAQTGAASYATTSTYGDNGPADQGLYLGADVGPAFIPDFESSRLGNPTEFSLQPGVRFGVEPGYNFAANGKLTFGVELETGVIYNRFSSVNDLVSGATYRGAFYQVPMLGSFVLKLHPGSFVVPYIGVGGGADYTLVRIHPPGFFGFHIHDDAVDPAAQGMVGVRFRLSDRSDLGVGYKFLADFSDDGRYIATHSVSATFTWRF